jgi:hypothetical protein
MLNALSAFAAVNHQAFSQFLNDVIDRIIGQSIASLTTAQAKNRRQMPCESGTARPRGIQLDVMSISTLSGLSAYPDDGALINERFQMQPNLFAEQTNGYQ